MQTEHNYLNPNSASNYASFGRRLVAAIIDGIIIAVPVGILSAIFGASLFGAASTSDDGELGAAAGMAFMGASAGIQLLSLALQVLYFAYFESTEKQASIGKQAMGIQVVSVNGQRLSFTHALGRSAAKLISGFICLIGYIMAAFTEKKQGLHDMIAGTLVVNKQA